MAQIVDHGDRAHSTWSASAGDRNMNCSGAMGMVLKFAPPEDESMPSARGTATHQVGDKCLKHGLDPASFLGKIEKTKQRKIEIDQELVESATMYVEYCRDLMRIADKYWIEQKFSLAKLKPPMDAGGTSDFIAYVALTRTLYVVDLKNGRNLVDVVKNVQARHYGLGAILNHPELAVDKVILVIVQPNAYHPQGRIRSETVPVGELIEFVQDLRGAWALAEEAKAALETMPLVAFGQRYLKLGDHCVWCDAKHVCPLQEQNAMDTAGVFFRPVDNRPALAIDPESGNGAAIATDLEVLDLIEDWVEARRRHAKRQADAGVKIPGYGLVESEGREAWLPDDTVEQKIFAAAVAADLKPAEYLNPGKLRTPKQIRKALGKYADMVEGLSATPKRGTSLVKLADTSKPEQVAPALKFFAPVAS